MPKFKLSPLALLITSSLALNVNAEEVNAESTVTENVQERDVERIIIRGTKQELTLQEVDASVEVFNEARLDAERIIDINDALLRIPNVSSNGNSNSISIRGISRAGAAGQGVTSNVYVDGAPLSGVSLSRGLTSLWDTQQVEILRGSQSSIQGRNALAGAIVVTTADPTYDPEGKVRLTYAEDKTYQIAGAYSNAIIDNQLAFRLAADIQKSDGFIDHEIASDNADFEDRLLLRGKLLFEPEAIDDLSIKLTFDHTNSDSGESRKAINTSFDVTDEEFETFDAFDFTASGRFPQNDVQSTRVILDTYYELSDNWAIKSILTHENTTVVRNFGFADQVVEFGLFASNRTDQEISSAELRFTFDYEHFSGVIGGYYFEDEAEQDDFNVVNLADQVAIATNGFGTVTNQDAILTNAERSIVDTTNAAFFAQVRIDLSESLILDLGIRYDDEKFENSGLIESSRELEGDNCFATVPGVLVGAPGFVTAPCATVVALALDPVATEDSQSESFNAWLPKATLTYNIDKDHSVFASAQRGYRAGGSFIVRVANETQTGTEQIVQTYDPEFLNTFEIGSRSVFSDGKVIFNSNLFYSLYKDQQIELLGINIADDGDDEIVNAAESTIYGAELSLEYYVTQELDLYASVGLLKAEYDDFPFAEEGEFSNLAGNQQPNAPEFNASIGANWISQSGWFANISAFYTGSRFSNIENLDNSDLFQPAIDAGVSEAVASSLTEKVDSYVNVNVRFGYELDNVTIYAYGTNVFDEEVITNTNIASVNQVSGNVSFGTDGTNTTILPPRTFGIGIDYSF